MNADDIAVLHRWFERGELSQKLLSLLRSTHPQHQCMIGEAVRTSRMTNAPLMSFVYQRRAINSHFDVTRRITGPTRPVCLEDYCYGDHE